LIEEGTRMQTSLATRRIGSCLALLLTSGCATPAYTGVMKETGMNPFQPMGGNALALRQASAQNGGRAPEITSFDAEPREAPAGTPLRFTLIAHDPDAQPLHITWATTSGALSANSGTTVSWQAGAQPEAGPATLEALVSDGFTTTKATARLTIGADGSVKLEPQGGAAVPAVPAPAVPGAVSVAPTLTPGVDTLVEAKPEPAKPVALFEEDFSVDSRQWQIDGAKGWEVADSALVLADPGAMVSLKQRSFYLKTLKPIDLKTAGEPRLRLSVKNDKGSRATFKAVWQSADTALPEETLIGTRFEGEQDWATKEFDLSLLKGRSGRLILMAKAEAGARPMLDEVTVYDAATR
jgi:hypothetical protein